MTRIASGASGTRFKCMHKGIEIYKMIGSRIHTLLKNDKIIAGINV